MFGSASSVIVRSNQGLNDSSIDSAELAKSSTRTSSWDLSGWMRLSRDSVCTAATPSSFLSTYMPHSSGWSNPVWNFSATTSSWYSSRSRAAACGSSALT